MIVLEKAATVVTRCNKTMWEARASFFDCEPAACEPVILISADLFEE